MRFLLHPLRYLPYGEIVDGAITPPREPILRERQIMRASKRARNQRADTVQPLPIPASIVLPDDLKADIADTVRAFTYMQVMGGTCIVRGLVGHKLLREIGLDAKLTHGAMLFRAGSDPMADVVAYCGLYNIGYVDTFMLGHLWTELGDDLIATGRCGPLRQFRLREVFLDRSHYRGVFDEHIEVISNVRWCARPRPVPRFSRPCLVRQTALPGGTKAALVAQMKARWW